jgi:hypothetical protein
MAGGAAGATVFAAGSSSAASSTAAQGTTGPTGPRYGAPDGAPHGSGPGGRFVPNENGTHEQSESSQREAQETAGQFPTVP